MNSLSPTQTSPDMAQSCISIRVKDNLSCAICLDFLSDPATIPCGHSFCIVCIQGFWDVEAMFERTCCPTCSHTFPSKPILFKNLTLADLVRDLEGSSGSEAAAQGKRGAAFASPANRDVHPPKRSITSTSEAQDFRACQKHDRLMEVYCCKEEQCICTLCAAVDHRGHTVVPVNDQRMQKQEKLADITKSCDRMIQRGEKELEHLKKTVRQTEERGQAEEEHCEGVFAGLVDSIQRHVSTVMNLIRAQEKAVQGQAQTSLKELVLWLAVLRRRHAELEQLSHTQDDIQFLQRWSSLATGPEARDWPSVPVSAPFEAMRAAVEEIGGRLEAFFNKEINTLSQMVDRFPDVPEILPAPAAQTREPTTRSEFLQCACELTLDSDTAHKDLFLSTNKKMVTCDPKKVKNSVPVPYKADRFARRRQVLCKEGLEGEQCYFEVEVDGEKAEIALTYKGLDRGSLSPSSALGGNKVSWSLDRSKTYSVSHKANSVQLIATPDSRKIGVYIKFKEGTLSFYEVSENTMKLLYKTVTTFSEPLYPGFWLGDMCTIKLCDLKNE
ncbi:tripartite motif-containing protein 16-like protein [Osmerus mordax]|uniref:tripartite motif-containing protein 16-like protein n=1 Tax=Osmerus mordax TaxID=8014 RepID=UPI003510CAE6